MANKFFRFLKRKRNIWFICILATLIFLSWLIFGWSKGSSPIQTGFATKQDLKETVLATGQVVSGTDLDLSFQASGIVRRVLVKEGDKVNAGQTIAYLDQSAGIASLVTAKGALAQAQANYDKLLAGTASEDIRIAQNSVDSAEQDLNNEYNEAVNTLNNAYIKIYNAHTFITKLQQDYFTASDQQGIKVSENRDVIGKGDTSIKGGIDAIKSGADKENIENAIFYAITHLNNVSSALKIIRDTVDDAGYYSKVLIADKSSIDTFRANINSALSDITTSQNSIASGKVALQKAENSLAQKTALPRQPDIDFQKAQILSAQGQVDSAQAILSNTLIIAPTSGTITQIDIKAGEHATALARIMILQDIGNMHAEADVSEANIASLEIGQTIDYTLDALGPDKHFLGKVLTINPSSTIVSGVVNYKVKGSLDNIEKIKPGMTANMTILVAKKDNVLAVPSTSVINKNDKNYVRVIEDKKKKSFREIEVQTGLRGDGGLVEIISGLNEGQEIVTYIK